MDSEQQSRAPKPSKPRAVVPEEWSREQPSLERAYVGVLKEQRSAGRAIAGLAELLPCPRHLKRCHGRRVYLAPQGVGGPAELLELLGRRGFPLSLFEPELQLAEVPAAPPRSRAQMRVAAAHWPLHFHPDPRLEALLSGEALDPDLLRRLQACARVLAGVAGPGCGGAAAVLQPPAESARSPPRLLALAVAQAPERHPLWHAAMLAVDLVARRQAGGAWPLLEKEEETRSKRPRRDGPLVFPPGLALEAEALAQLGTPERERDDEAAYLCTGYWVVLVREPCAMCAMALLHARAAKVFYGAGEARTGVLGSRAMLHCLPGLNHRYEVWSGLLGSD